MLFFMGLFHLVKVIERFKWSLLLLLVLREIKIIKVFVNWEWKFVDHSYHLFNLILQFNLSCLMDYIFVCFCILRSWKVTRTLKKFLEKWRRLRYVLAILCYINGTHFFLKQKGSGRTHIWFIRLVFQGHSCSQLDFLFVWQVHVSRLMLLSWFNRKAEPLDKLKEAQSLFIDRMSERLNASSLQEVFLFMHDFNWFERRVANIWLDVLNIVPWLFVWIPLSKDIF